MTSGWRFEYGAAVPGGINDAFDSSPWAWRHAPAQYRMRTHSVRCDRTAAGTLTKVEVDRPGRCRSGSCNTRMSMSLPAADSRRVPRLGSALVAAVLAVAGCGVDDEPPSLDSILLEENDLGSAWSSSPSGDPGPDVRADWCSDELIPVDGRLDVAFVAWANDDSEIQIVGQRIERYTSSALEIAFRGDAGLPCTVVERGTTVQLTEQETIAAGDEAVVVLMEALDGPDQGQRFVWQVQVRYGDVVLRLSMSDDSADRDEIERVVSIATRKADDVLS